MFTEILPPVPLDYAQNGNKKYKYKISFKYLKPSDNNKKSVKKTIRFAPRNEVDYVET